MAFGLEGWHCVEEGVERLCEGVEGRVDLRGALMNGDEGAVFSKAERGELARDERGLLVDDLGLLLKRFEGETAQTRRDGARRKEGRDG